MPHTDAPPRSPSPGMASALDFHLRSYGRQEALEQHAWAQWVLPVAGEMGFEVDGRQHRLDVLQGAFAAPGEWHAQDACAVNRFLIIDVPPLLVEAGMLEDLRRHPWLALPGALRRALQREDVTLDAGLQASCMQALLATFAPHALSARLHALCTRMQAELDMAWPVERMAAAVGVSVSRLHALFRMEFDLSPQAWLSSARLRRARQQLLSTDLPIARIALDAGYSEHSALTRALRRETGLSPQAWRQRRNAPTAWDADSARNSGRQ